MAGAARARPPLRLCAVPSAGVARGIEIIAFGTVGVVLVRPRLRKGHRQRKVGCYASEKGVGILTSMMELPKTAALGIELRLDRAVGAPVSIIEGDFSEEQFRVDYELCGDAARDQDTIAKAVKATLRHFKWKGVVGCAIKSGVSEVIGPTLGAFLKRRFKSQMPFFQAISSSAAVGYFELVWGETADSAYWKGQVILVCTLSSDIQLALYNNGRRINNFSLGRESLQRWRTLVRGDEPDEVPVPPSPGDEDWGRWAGLADQHISAELKQFNSDCGKLDRIVIMPTGRLTKMDREQIRPVLGRTLEVAGDMGCDVVLTASPLTAGIRGAAVGAVVGLQEQQLLRTLQPMLNAGDSLQDLSSLQIRSVFQRLDTSGDGHLDTAELLDAMEIVGVRRDPHELLKELDEDASGSVDIDEFMKWWERSVQRAEVVTITSAEAWERILTEAKDGAHSLKLLMVTFTFCRTCRAFEPKFQRAARNYPGIRFVQLVGNGTVGAMDLCTQKLGVEQSPSFFLFGEEGQQLEQWTGGKIDVFDEKLAPYAAEQTAAA